MTFLYPKEFTANLSWTSRHKRKKLQLVAFVVFSFFGKTLKKMLKICKNEEKVSTFAWNIFLPESKSTPCSPHSNSWFIKFLNILCTKRALKQKLFFESNPSVLSVLSVLYDIQRIKVQITEFCYHTWNSEGGTSDNFIFNFLISF